MNVIEIKDLTFTYPGAQAPTLSHVDLQIEKGDFLAVVGNNGCGKSTLCKIINGLIPHFITGEFRGKVLVDGEDTWKANVGILARKAGYVYQDFENQIVRPTALDDASYACLNYGMEDYLERGREALGKCGLAGREEDFIWQLSGGQTHLLALAGAVALGPDILILDEPIAQLDPYHADRIYDTLRKLNEELEKTIIVIEHHTEYIADYCKHVMLLKEGRPAWLLPVEEALNRVEELEQNNIFPPQVTIAGHRLQGKGYRQKMPLPTTVEAGRSFFAGLCCRLRDGSGKLPGTEVPDTVAALQNISVSYRSVRGEPADVFKGLSLELHRGEKIALIGSNGAGKSTLMKLLIGLLKAPEGEVILGHTVIKDISPQMLSRYISLVYQNPEDMFIKDSVRSDIAYAMQVRSVENWEKRTEELLDRFHLTELAERDGRLLSGGQMRRASLAIGIALNPEILLLDEPTANLDIATRKEIMGVLNDIKNVTQTVMIATHDMQLVCEWAERIIVLYRGRIVADGSRDEIFGDSSLTKLVGIRPPQIFSMGRELAPEALCYTVEEFLDVFQTEREDACG